ncbi:MAG: hypothetical protein EOO68_32130 [Moraxellaceae bacterium]|nr:MAG: hypothetical protein EOO68_32130 [Moraxellaceae bacterium]
MSLAQTFTAGGEGLAFWQHLKAAGFINGSASATNVDALPKNAFGGLIGITTDPLGVGAAPAIGGRVVCLSQVPGKSAAAIDTQRDDGNGNTGKMRAIVSAPGANTAPSNATGPLVYSEAAFYTICEQM